MVTVPALPTEPVTRIHKTSVIGANDGQLVTIINFLDSMSPEIRTWVQSITFQDNLESEVNPILGSITIKRGTGSRLWLLLSVYVTELGVYGCPYDSVWAHVYRGILLRWNPPAWVRSVRV